MAALCSDNDCFILRYKGRKAGVIASIFWTIWTFVIISFTPLVLLQLGVAWGSFWIFDVITKQKRELEKFRKAVSSEDKETQQSLYLSYTDAKYALINDGSHYSYMIEKIEESSSNVLILSGWISSAVIDSKFLKVLESALLRGVEVSLGFGYQDNDGKHDLSRGAEKALNALLRLTEKYSRLKIGKFNNHQKLLIIDKTNVVCGSHNWLSNKRGGNREQSISIQDNHTANKLYDRSVMLINENQIYASTKLNQQYVASGTSA